MAKRIKDRPSSTETRRFANYKANRGFNTHGYNRSVSPLSVMSGEISDCGKRDWTHEDYPHGLTHH